MRKVSARYSSTQREKKRQSLTQVMGARGRLGFARCFWGGAASGGRAGCGGGGVRGSGEGGGERRGAVEREAGA